MHHNSNIVISDTSCLILLTKINELELLNKLGRKVYVTPIIKAEFKKVLPEWISIVEPKQKNYQKILELDLDRGEASAIALALDFDNAVLLIDDLKGRIIADRLKLKYSGTLGLILRLKQEGKIKNVKPLINKIRKTNFRFSERLIQTIIEDAGEKGS